MLHHRRVASVREAQNYGKLGTNKYLIVWVDFTSIEFRKACFGLITENGGENPYRTDDYDQDSPFYYLADGTSDWVTLSHGNDGCFGTAQKGGINGYKGYLAIPTQYFREGSSQLHSNSVVVGIYMYADIKDGSYANKPFYLDNITLAQEN